LHIINITNVLTQTSLTPVMLYAWPMIKPFGSSASSLLGSAYNAWKSYSVSY